MITPILGGNSIQFDYIIFCSDGLKPNYLLNVILFNWVLLQPIFWGDVKPSCFMGCWGPRVAGSFNQHKFHWRKSPSPKSWGQTLKNPEVWVPCPNLVRWGHPLGETRGHSLGIWWGLGMVRVFKKNGKTWEFSGIQLLLPGSCWFASI